MSDVSNDTVIATGSSTARTLATRAADWVNVMDYGAVLNGTTNDTSAVASAYAAVPANGILKIPSGGWNISNFPALTGNKLWQFTGNSYGTSSSLVDDTGDDTTETISSGGRAWFRTATMPQTGGPLQSYYTLNMSNPNPGVYSNFSAYGSVEQSPSCSGIYGLWNIKSVLNVSGGNESGNSAQHVGVSSTVWLSGTSGQRGGWPNSNSGISGISA